MLQSRRDLSRQCSKSLKRAILEKGMLVIRTTWSQTVIKNFSSESTHFSRGQEYGILETNYGGHIVVSEFYMIPTAFFSVIHDSISNILCMNVSINSELNYRRNKLGVCINHNQQL